VSNAEKFTPVRFNPKTYAKARGKTDAKFARAFEQLDTEFAVLDVLLRARRDAGLTQAEVAQRMGIAPASLARIEASVASHKHAPSLTTLRKYAQACGKRLSIALH
jgi:DNA-binding XRE family transcriptional regulator